MNQSDRPRVAALVLSQLIDAAPSRVRKRLDKEPEIADSWEWETTEDGWMIAAGEETVTLRVTANVLDSVEAASCSCLLSPRCFHLLACVNRLQPAGELAVDTVDIQTDSKPTNTISETSVAEVSIDGEMRETAIRVRRELQLLIQVGARRADLLRQSGLLRAAHQCRAVGLINLGNQILRIIESLRRQRDNSDTADSQALTEGMSLALQQSEMFLSKVELPRAVVGQARREFESCDVGKLVGVCAEPILTLSGYAGVVIYLQAVDSSAAAKRHHLFNVGQARPGDSQWTVQAYRGGIDMGNQTLQASEVCRRQLLVQNLTVSSDGRLGKGQSTRWVLTERSSNVYPFSQGRFGNSLREQVADVFESAALPVEQRTSGWDLIAFDAQILGAQGSALVVRVVGSDTAWKLRIANDHPALAFRHNLSLLARCPQLLLRCLGRMRIHSAGEIDLLAIAQGNVDLWRTEKDHGDSLPKLNIDDAWKGICNLGLDRLERSNIEGIRRWSEEVQLDTEGGYVRGQFEGVQLDGLESLRRRQVAVALGGRHSVADISSETHRRDRSHLRQRQQHTAVQLLDLLAISSHQRAGNREALGTEKSRTVPELDQVFLANWLYLQNATRHFQQQLWQQKLGSL